MINSVYYEAFIYKMTELEDLVFPKCFMREVTPCFLVT